MEISSQGDRYDSFITGQPRQVASTAVLVKDPYAEVFANQLFPPEDSEEAAILTDYKVQSIASLLIGKGRPTTALAMADGDRPSQFIRSFLKSSSFLTDSQVSLLFGYQLLRIANPYNFIFTKTSLVLMIIPPIYTFVRPFNLVVEPVQNFLCEPHHHVLFLLSGESHFSLLWMFSDEHAVSHAKHFDSLTLRPHLGIATQISAVCGISLPPEALTPYVQARAECGIFTALAAATLAAEILNAEGINPDAN